MMFSLDYLKGKKPLSRAFWIYGLLIPAIYFCVMGALFAAVIYFQSHYTGSDWTVIQWMILGASLIGLPIGLFGMLAVWQSAGNTTARYKTILAVLFVVFMLAQLPSKWVWLIHPAKGEVLKQTVLVGVNWGIALLVALIACWFYLGASKVGALKQRVIPVLLSFVVVLQFVQTTVYRPFAVQVLVGENGSMSIGHVLDYQAKQKRMDRTMLENVAVLEKKAQEGNADAAYDLGSALMAEDFSGANNTEAVRWLQFAIDHGVTFAKNELALLYQEGRGVDKDQNKALALFKEGSEAGDDTATYNLGLMYERGDAGKLDYAMAAKLYKRVVERTGSNPDGGCAENDLGVLYLLGNGVKADEVEARSLFEEAARKEIAVRLPVGAKEIRLPKDFDFPPVYAEYRMSVIRKQPIKNAEITPDEIKVAQLVAEHYEKKCRG